MINKIFEVLELNPIDAKVYEAALELGPASVQSIARKAKIVRTTAYRSIDRLKEKGLMSVSVKGNKKYFVAEDPEKLKSLTRDRFKQVEEANKTLEKILPKLKGIANTVSGKPKVRFYEGIEGLKSVYDETLNYKEILVHCMTESWPKLMPDYLPWYFKQVQKKGIKTREIVETSPGGNEYCKLYSGKNNIIKQLPKKYQSETDYMIYGNKVAFLSYNRKNPVGIVIEDGEIVRHEKIHFEVMWKALEAGVL